MNGKATALLLPSSVLAFQSLVRFLFPRLPNFFFGDPLCQVHIDGGDGELVQGVDQVQVDGGLVHLALHQLSLQGGVVDRHRVREDVRPVVLVVFHQGAANNHSSLKAKGRSPLQGDEKKVLLQASLKLRSTVSDSTLSLGAAVKVLSIRPRVPWDAPSSQSFSWFLSRLSLDEEPLEGSIAPQGDPEVLARQQDVAVQRDVRWSRGRSRGGGGGGGGGGEAVARNEISARGKRSTSVETRRSGQKQDNQQPARVIIRISWGSYHNSAIAVPPAPLSVRAELPN